MSSILCEEAFHFICLKIAGVVSRTFSVVYESFPMVWISLFTAERPDETARCIEEGRENKMADERTSTVAPSSFLILIVLGTNARCFELTFFFLSVLFRTTPFSSFVFVFVFCLRRRLRNINSSSFYLCRVLVRRY